MNVLSLCAGVGGFDLGIKRGIPEARTVCWVENDPFCQAVLLARMGDGLLDRAPIWGDLRTFDGRPWRGVVDCVATGFPCQPFSTAGKRRGVADARNLWPDVRRVIAESEPAVVLLENVPGALLYVYHVVLPELSGLGYAVETRLVTAAEVGAPHRRQRIFVVAHGAGERQHGIGLHVRSGRPQQNKTQVAGDGPQLSVADAEATERWGPGDQEDVRWRVEETGRSSGIPTWPPGPTERDRWAAILARWPDLAPAVEDSK